MQSTELSINFKGETADNQKPAYMTELNNSRAMGLLDANLDGKVDKTELHGRIGQMVLTNFDMLDADKDGFITATEARRTDALAEPPRRGGRRQPRHRAPVARPQ